MNKLNYFALFFLGFSFTNVYGWVWKELGEEFSTPVTTDAKAVTIYGSAATLTLVLFKDQLVTPVQKEAVRSEPLGHYSHYGDLAGQLIPNILYVGTQSILGARGDEKGYGRAMGMLKATLYSSAVTTALKYSIREPRPDNIKEKNSFPSGHSTTAFAFGGYVLEEHGWKAGVPALLLSAFVGASRINDNRHFLSDVVAGATIGLAYGIGISKYEKAKAKKENKTSSDNEVKTSTIVMPIYSHDLRGLALVREF